MGTSRSAASMVAVPLETMAGSAAARAVEVWPSTRFRGACGGRQASRREARCAPAGAARTNCVGEAEMEAGKSGEDGEGGLAALGFGDEAAHDADQRRKVAEDFRDADH